MISQGTETVRKLLVAHFQGDDAGFRSAAWEVVQQERQLNHTVLANDLERILSETNGSPKAAKTFFTTLSTGNGILPKDKDKNACLIEVTDPDRELDDLVLSPPVRAGIDRVLRERRSSELLRSHGVKPVQKLLLCGPPGCGKTVTAEALAHALYMPLATVRFDAVVSSYLGETAGNLRKVFDFARIRPVLLFFDEFDAIGKHRTASDEHGELKRVVNSFLQLLDGFHSETLTVAAVPLMLERSGGGSIINISSTMGRLAGRGFAAYSTAKAALAHYTRLTALDLCPRIRVNAIAPGSILTSALDVVASNDALREPMEKATPLRRLGEPVDIAAAAVYLASPAGSYLTGKMIEVDGGLTVPNLDLPIPDL